MSFLKFVPHHVLEGHEIAKDLGYSVVRGWSIPGQIEVKTPDGNIRRFSHLDDAETFILNHYNGEVE